MGDRAPGRGVSTGIGHRQEFGRCQGLPGQSSHEASHLIKEGNGRQQIRPAYMGSKGGRPGRRCSRAWARRRSWQWRAGPGGASRRPPPAGGPGPPADQGEGFPHRLPGRAGGHRHPAGARHRAREPLRNVAAAYVHYNNPAGASFEATKVRPAAPITEPLPPVTGTLRSRNVLGAGDGDPTAPPGAGGPIAHGAALRGEGPAPPAGRVPGSAPMGDTVGGKPRRCFSPDTNSRHHLYVARTRMGSPP